MKMKQLCFSFFVTLVFVACGSGGSGSDSKKEIDNNLNYTSKIKVSDNLLSLGSYLVCVDFNESFTCEENELASKLEGNMHTFVSKNQKLQNAVLLAKLNDSKPIYFATKSIGDKKTVDLDLNSSLEIALMQNGISQAEAKNVINNSTKKLAINETNISIFKENILKVFKNLDYKTIGSILLKGLPENIAKSNFDIEKLKKKTSNKIVLNDTGVKKYFNGISLENSSSLDFPGQDADFGLDKTDDGFKFKKLDEKGNILDDNSTSFSCVKDERTGLIWEIKSDDKQSPSYKFSTFAIDATQGIKVAKIKALNNASCNNKNGLDSCKVSSYITYLNNKNYCGKNDWKVPSYMDYFNILDFSIDKTITINDIVTKNEILYYGLDTKYFKDLYASQDDFPYEKRGENKITLYSHMYYWTSSYSNAYKGNFLANPISKNPFVSAIDNGEEVFHLRLISNGN